MNTSALIGMFIGGLIIVYLFRNLFLYLLKKFLKVDENRNSKNLALILSAAFTTVIYYLATDTFNLLYFGAGIILFLLGLIPTQQKIEETEK